MLLGDVRPLESKEANGEEVTRICMFICIYIFIYILCRVRCIFGDSLENVPDERVHGAHGAGRETEVGMHLLQHL